MAPVAAPIRRTVVIAILACKRNFHGLLDHLFQNLVFSALQKKRRIAFLGIGVAARADDLGEAAYGLSDIPRLHVRCALAHDYLSIFLKKHVLLPVWHAGPSASTSTRSVSESQSA